MLCHKCRNESNTVHPFHPLITLVQLNRCFSSVAKICKMQHRTRDLTPSVPPTNNCTSEKCELSKQNLVEHTAWLKRNRSNLFAQGGVNFRTLQHAAYVLRVLPTRIVSLEYRLFGFVFRWPWWARSRTVCA